jgi:hypothetical protein
MADTTSLYYVYVTILFINPHQRAGYIQSQMKSLELSSCIVQSHHMSHVWMTTFLEFLTTYILLGLHQISVLIV